MQRLIISKSLLLIIILGIVFLSLTLVSPAYAKETIATKSGSQSIKATVGGIRVIASGFIAPYTSIVLSSDGNVYRTTVSDEKGFFSIENLLPIGFSTVCFSAVDAKRLGESYSCLSPEIPKGDLILKDIFLPPTIGLNHNQVTEGSDALIYGYTMPSARVKIKLMAGKETFITADNLGYYEYILKKVKAGSYELFAGATYKGKDSQEPIKPAVLKAVAVASSFIDSIKRAWVLIAVLILVGILVILVMRHKKLLRLTGKKLRALHHAWFIGY